MIQLTMKTIVHHAMAEYRPAGMITAGCLTQDLNALSDPQCAAAVHGKMIKHHAGQST